MNYYNKYTAKKVWKVLDTDKNVDRNKRRYVQKPNPGRPYEDSVPLFKLLKKTYEIRDVVQLKKLILTRQIKVNQNVVTDLKHPVHNLDYLTCKDQHYQIIFNKFNKLIIFNLKKYESKQLYYNVKRWFLKDNKCMVLTFQNKLFTFEIEQALFDKLRKIDSVIIKDLETKSVQVSNIFDEKVPNSVYRLTGKLKYKDYHIKDLKIEGQLKGSKVMCKLVENNKIESKENRQIEIDLKILDFKKRFLVLALNFE